jgi:hypothetical protein
MTDISEDKLADMWKRKTALNGYVPNCLPTGHLNCDECGCQLTLDCWLTGLEGQVDTLYCERCQAFYMVDNG